MLVLHGSPALSEFRRRRLLAELRRSIPGIIDVQADYVYFVALAHELSTEERARLEELASSAAPAQAKSNGELFVVIPRLGTISPWASKATDIAHVCGLAAVARIERGIAYYLFSKSNLEQDARTCINTLIHDRMTQ